VVTNHVSRHCQTPLAGQNCHRSAVCLGEWLFEFTLGGGRVRKPYISSRQNYFSLEWVS
jgi:hypothetical protein